MHDDVHDLKALLDRCEALMQETHTMFGAIIERVRAHKYENDALCDLGFLFREIAAVHDELRKEANAKKDLCSLILCRRLTEAAMEDEDAAMTAHGTLASGSPDLRQVASLPKYGTPEYQALLQHFGVPQEAIDAGVFSVSFNRFADHLTILAEKGENPPPGTGKVYAKFNIRYRRRT